MMTSLRPANDGSILSLREGSTTIALAVLIPLAIQGLLLSLLWTVAQLGSSAPEFVGSVNDGRAFGLGSTLSPLIAVLVILAIRYVIFAVYWVIMTRKSGDSIGRAFLAALPLAGLWWSLGISSRIARGIGSSASFKPSVLIPMGVIAGVAVLALPLSMGAATAADKDEAERLASPCINLFPAVDVDDPVISVGDRKLSQQNLDAFVEEVIQQQRGAAARKRETWPVDVADVQVWMALTNAMALSVPEKATVADMERQISEWADSPGDDLSVQLASFGIPPSQDLRYACAVQQSSILASTYSTDSSESGLSEYERRMQLVAERVGVEIDPSIGYWNPSTLSVQSEPPIEPILETADVLEDEIVDEDPAPRRFATRVEYDIASIPTQVFDDTLTWQADICLTASELLQDRFKQRIQLFERVAGRWVPVRSAVRETSRGGRCSGGQVNLLIGTTEAVPPANWTDKGWRTCRDYQVRIPETPTFRSTSVDLCVATQAESLGEGA